MKNLRAWYGREFLRVMPKVRMVPNHCRRKLMVLSARAVKAVIIRDYIKPADFKYAEAAQLTYTLTRPDVYNAIMALPGYSHYLEEELGVDKSKGVDSFDLVLTQEAITIESRMYWRAKQKPGAAIIIGKPGIFLLQVM